MSFKKIVILISSVLVSLYALFSYGFLELGSVVHPDMKINFKNNKFGIYLHVFFSLVALGVGPF